MSRSYAVAWRSTPIFVVGMEFTGQEELELSPQQLVSGLAALNLKPANLGEQPDYLSLAHCYLQGLGTEVDYDFGYALCQKMVRDGAGACAPELAFLCMQVVESAAEFRIKQSFVQLILPFCDLVAAGGNGLAAWKLGNLCRLLQKHQELNSQSRLVPLEQVMKNYAGWVQKQHPISLVQSHGLLAYYGLGVMSCPMAVMQ